MRSTVSGQLTGPLCATQASNRACLVVLHDLSLAARYCDRLYLMHDGRLVAEGAPAAVLNHSNLQQVYGVEVEFGDGEFPSIVPVRET